MKNKKTPIKVKLSEYNLEQCLVLLRAIQEPKNLQVKYQNFDKAAKLREQEIKVLDRMDELLENIEFN